MTYIYTALAMLAFAANSILCRLALGEGSIDAGSFTAIRLVSGALTLGLLITIQQRGLRFKKPDLFGALFLFSYAICFSFSYVAMAASTGALILFASVQLTMIGYGLSRGERPSMINWLGIAMAVGGFVVLVLPGATAPPLVSAALMALAGIAWGGYSLRGRGAKQPLISTGWNFIGTLPLVAVLMIMVRHSVDASFIGVALAVASGSLASGVGYAIWYAALPKLPSLGAASVQLTVPVITALGGILLLDEQLTLRLIGCSVVILSGVYLTLIRRQPK